MMTRTQVYLPQDLREELQLIVRQEQTTMADFIRESVAEKVEKKKKKKISFSDAMSQIRIKGTKKDRYISRDIDKILYG